MIMFSFTHLFFGLVAAGLGLLAIKYTFQLVGYTGNQNWIESKLGGGSTYLVYKIFGLLLIIFGLLYALGLGNTVGQFLFSPLTSLFAPFAQR